MLRAGNGTITPRNAHYRFVGVASSPPPIVCAYPLASTLSQVQAAGYNGLLPVSNHQQTATYTVQGSQVNAQNYAVFTNFLVLQTLNFSSGQRAVEFGFTVPTSLVTLNADIDITGEMFTTNLAHSVRVATGSRTRGGVNTYALVVAVDGLSRYLDFNRATKVDTVAVWIDAATSKLRLYVNNDPTPIILSSDSVTPALYFLGVETLESVLVSPLDAGKQYVCDVRTGAPNFQTTVLPAGTRDGCGNLIGS